MFKIQVQFDDGGWSTIFDYESKTFKSEEDAVLERDTDSRLSSLLSRGRVRVINCGLDAKESK